MSYLQEAVALDPEYMEAILVLMSVYMTEERYEDVLALYDDVKQDDFDWTALYPFVAEAYNKEERYSEAYEIYKLAYNDFNEDTEFLANFCYFLLEDGKLEEAKQVAERLLVLEPNEQQWLDLMERFD